MKTTASFQKKPSITIRWTEKDGFVTKSHRSKSDLKETDIRLITRYALPSGSNWSQYFGLRSVRLWNEGKFIILSISKINRIETIRNSTRYAPEADIYIFNSKDIDNLKPQDILFLIKNAFSDSRINIWEKLEKKTSISLERCTKYVTIENRADIKLTDAWTVIETSFVDEFIKAWPKNFYSFSTLCTPQDNTKIFTYVGFLKNDAESFPIKEHSIIGIDSRLGITIKKFTEFDYLKSTVLNWIQKKSNFSNLTIIILAMLFLILGFTLGNR